MGLQLGTIWAYDTAGAVNTATAPRANINWRNRRVSIAADPTAPLPKYGSANGLLLGQHHCPHWSGRDILLQPTRPWWPHQHSRGAVCPALLDHQPQPRPVRPNVFWEYP